MTAPKPKALRQEVDDITRWLKQLVYEYGEAYENQYEPLSGSEPINGEYVDPTADTALSKDNERLRDAVSFSARKWEKFVRCVNVDLRAAIASLRGAWPNDPGDYVSSEFQDRFENVPTLLTKAEQKAVKAANKQRRLDRGELVSDDGETK